MSSPSATKTEMGGSVPLWNQLSYPNRRRFKRAVFYLGLTIPLFIVLFPIFWMFNTSIRPLQTVITQFPQILPPTVTLENYQAILLEGEFPLFLRNSLIAAFGVVVLTTVFSTLGGYGLARLDLRFKRVFARGVLFGYMFPSILLSIPMFIFWRQLGIINSHIGLILAESALALPFSLWLMWKFFQTVPESLEESARMAGASRFRAFTDIALPMAKPGMIAVAIFSFSISWNAFTMPKILMPDRQNYVITVGLETLVIGDRLMWGEIMAGSFIAILPALLFIYFLQKYLLRGFRAGGIG